jgi:hypothetical protein
VFHFPQFLCLWRLIKPLTSTSQRTIKGRPWNYKMKKAINSLQCQSGQTSHRLAPHEQLQQEQPHAGLLSQDELYVDASLIPLSPCWPPLKSQLQLTFSLSCQWL